MSRGLSIVSAMILFAFVSAASGCSSISNPTLTSHRVAASIRETPQSLGSWTTKASMPTARDELAVGDINGILYAVGGCAELFCSGPLNTVEAYDPATDVWVSKAPMPTARRGLAVGVINGILYAAGGFGGNINSIGDENCCELDTVEAYDPATDTWTAKAPMPTARGFVAAGVINGILYVVGGRSGNGFVSTLEAYNPATNSWTTLQSMPSARWGLAASVVNGKLYALGGYNAHGTLNKVDAYDPATNTWKVRASMPAARKYLTSGVIRGRLYAVGGFDRAYLTTVEAYDSVTNTWTTKTPMPTKRAGLAAGVVQGILYAVGGYHSRLWGMGTVEAFNPR